MNRLLVVLSVTVSAVVVGIGHPSATVSASTRTIPTVRVAPPSGVIVYARRLDDERSDLFATRVDGSHTRRLTRTPGRELAPDVSPDGRRIAFARLREGKFGLFSQSEIWVSDTSGRGARRVTSGRADHDPAWSNDGRELLFSRHRFNTRTEWADAIHSIRLADGATKRLTNPPVDYDGVCDFDPAPWPGRSAVVFAHSSDCAHGNSGWIDAVDGSGRPVAVLAKLKGFFERLESFDVVQAPAFSPDGRTIAFDAIRTASPNAPEGIHLANADGSSLRRLTSSGASPAWSPDGRWIAFIRAGDVWIVRPDGTGTRRVTRTPRVEESPDWLS